MTELRLRHDVTPADRDAVRAIVRSSAFFNDAEVAVAVELVDDYLACGEASGYRFLFAEEGAGVIGYTCYGPIAGTRSSWDLYWIAVHAGQRGRGIGSSLLEATVEAIREAGGTRLYAETSSREQYAPTRHFYETHGFEPAVFLDDFYAPGDGKEIYFRPITVRR